MRHYYLGIDSLNPLDDFISLICTISQMSGNRFHFIFDDSLLCLYDSVTQQFPINYHPTKTKQFMKELQVLHNDLMNVGCFREGIRAKPNKVEAISIKRLHKLLGPTAALFYSNKLLPYE